MLDNPTVRLVNNWLHDVGTGLWAASLIAVWVLSRQANALAAQPAAQAAVRQAQLVMFWLMLLALVDIAITGAVRLLYWRAATPADELPSKRPALIGKHVAFFVVYGLGTVLGWWLLGH